MGDDETGLLALLRTVPGWATAELTVAPITTGLTNRNFRVGVAGEGTFVVRLPGERTEVLGIDRSCEAEATRRAAALGIAPSVRGDLPGRHTLITEFVDGRPAEPDDFRDLDRLAAVVGLLKRFHGSGPISGRFPIFRVIEWHARDAGAHGVHPPPLYDDGLAVASRIEAALTRHPLTPVACHNDLLPANVLFGVERAWLIDFEYAGMNDPFFDLANLSINCALDPAADDELLTLYFGAATDVTRARLAVMKVMSELREGMWAVVQQAISTLDTVDFVAYAAEHLGRALELATEPGLTTLLEQAAAPVPGGATAAPG
jgi:thiamine kinase-like enzyme